MHKVADKKFELDDFSCEHLIVEDDVNHIDMVGWLQKQIDVLNQWRRTVMLNYEVLAGIYISRKDHKLDEWKEFCKWIESLPYSELITGKEN